MVSGSPSLTSCRLTGILLVMTKLTLLLIISCNPLRGSGGAGLDATNRFKACPCGGSLPTD